MNPYPDLGNGTQDDLNRVVSVIVQQRQQDIQDANNIKNSYVSGRTVGKIPSGATDVSPSDKVGDVSHDSNYQYRVIDNNGTAEWRRSPLETF